MICPLDQAEVKAKSDEFGKNRKGELSEDEWNSRGQQTGSNEAGEYLFELIQMFPMQKMDESLMGTFPFIDKYGQYILKDSY